MAESAPDAEFTDPDEWPDPVLRERVARALSWHSDGRHRDDYQYHRGYWLGAADMALRASGLAEALADRDRARDVAVALEQEASVYGATSRAFGDDPDGEHDKDDLTIGRNPAGELDRLLGQEAEQQDNDDAAHAVLAGWQDPGHPIDASAWQVIDHPAVQTCTGASDCPVPADRHEEGCYATDNTDG